MTALRLVLTVALMLGAAEIYPQSGVRIYRIGIFTFGMPATAPVIQAFRDGLREEGYVEGKNALFEFRTVAGRADRAPAMAAELLRAKVDVIVTEGYPTALAAKHATTTVPIVMAVVGDPVKLGLVATLRRPGGNVTGLTLVGAERTKKQLQLLKEIAPDSSRVAVLYNPDNPATPDSLDDAKSAAAVLGLTLQLVEVRSPVALNAAFEKIAGGRPDALTSLGDGMLHGLHGQIAAFAVRSRLAGVFPEGEFAQAGALMAYGPNVAANFRRAGAIVAKVLKGANPADLAIEQPTKYDLIINLKAAKALGLKIPTALLVRADQVIQ